MKSGCFTVTGLQRENVTKYAVLSRNCCIIDAGVGSSSYGLSAQGRLCLYESAAIEKMKPSKKIERQLDLSSQTSCVTFFTFSHNVIKNERSALLVKWLNRDVGKKGL